ncbi:MAG: helix-turn-helix transcriptional regulator [Chloroflexi bacterium]|nr:helix-turn-helix transcriptional regulator [Chloroflexota bacterium]
MPQQTRTRRPIPDSTTVKELGARIRRARTEAGLSQGALAAPNFTRAYVSAIELGKIRPSMKALEYLANRLGKPTSFFLSDEAEESERKQREFAIAELSSRLTRARAAEALSSAEELLAAAKSHREIATLRMYRATALNFLQRGREALPDLEASERLAKQLGDERLSAQVNYQRAIGYRLVGDPLRAKHLLEEHLAKVEAAPVIDALMRMKLLKDLGAIAYDLGQHEAASAYYFSALEWSKDVSDMAALATIYQGLALSYRARGDLDAATTYLQRAIGASEAANDLTQIAMLYNAMALFAAERGHLQSARTYSDKAIELARVTGPAAFVPHYVTTKAECAAKAGMWQDAAGFAAQALALATEHQNVRAAAAARLVLSDAASHLGQVDEGVRHLKEAATAYEELNAFAELGEVFQRLSRLAETRGQSDEARHYLIKAYEATRKPSGLMERK